MSKEVEDFLQGGSGKAAKFEQMGDSVTGRITDLKLSQQTSMEDNTPLTWDDGSPRMQLVVTLQTDQREGEEDDGLRRVYAKGGSFEVAEGSGKSLKEAIAEACKRAEVRSLDEGGTLTVGFTGLAKKKNRGYQAAKLYKAKYEPPKASVPASDLFD
jgi:hypothetical protein